MSRKILVTRKWHEEAMIAMREIDKVMAFKNGLESFILTKLTPQQQRDLELEIDSFMQDFKQ